MIWNSLNHSMRRGQRQVFSASCITYAGYYLCRLNFNQVQGALGCELGLGEADLGKILFSFTLLYAVGHLINGFICDRVGAHRMAMIGAFGSAAMCGILPLFTSLWMLMCVWAVNGFFQSMGYGACARVLTNWFTPSSRGRVVGLFSLSFQLGNMSAWLLAAQLADTLGWQYSFYVPAGLLIVIGLYTGRRMIDAPEDVHLPALEHYHTPNLISSKQSDENTVCSIFSSKKIWIAAIAACFLSVAAYGFLFWLPQYLQSNLPNISQTASALRAGLYLLAGWFGSLLVGWISDHWLDGRRPPVIAVFIAFATICMIAFGKSSPASSPVLNSLMLALTGLFLTGAHIHIVTSLAMDFSNRHSVGTATGILNGMSNAGGLIASLGSGFIVEAFGWSSLFPVWSLSCLVAITLMGLLWSKRLDVFATSPQKQGSGH